MKDAEKIAADILAWGRAHAWHGKAASRLKSAHEAYLRLLLDKMDGLNEFAMNRAWAALPPSQKLSDAGSRVVCELIVSYSAAKKEIPHG